MLDAINRHKNDDPPEFVSAVRQEIIDFTDGQPQSDDITMLCLKYYGQEP